jgi:hypothetical protein
MGESDKTTSQLNNLQHHFLILFTLSLEVHEQENFGWEAHEHNG